MLAKRRLYPLLLHPVLPPEDIATSSQVAQDAACATFPAEPAETTELRLYIDQIQDNPSIQEMSHGALPRHSYAEPATDNRAELAQPTDKISMEQLLSTTTPLVYEPWRVDPRPETAKVGPGARLLRDVDTNTPMLWQDEMTDPGFAFIWLPDVHTENDGDLTAATVPANTECIMPSGGNLERRPSCKKAVDTVEDGAGDARCFDLQTIADMLCAEINYRLGSYGCVVTMHAVLDKLGIRATTPTRPEKPVHPMMRRVSLVQFADTAADTGEPNALGASLARVEERVCNVMLAFQAALMAWAKGLTHDARDGLEKLCENDLVCCEQEPHIENECNAYCAEYGSVSMARLRYLIFANTGYVHIAITGEQPLASFDEAGMESTESDLARAPVRPEAEEALRKAMTLMTSALQLGPAETAHYLAMGQCAMLLGQLDLAMSAFASGVGPVQGSLEPHPLPSNLGAQCCTGLEQVINKRFGPLQWRCVRAIVQASLARGDAELAFRIVNKVAELSPDLSHSLILTPNLQPSASLPVATLLSLNMLAAPPVSLPRRVKTSDAPVLSLRANAGCVSLAELGTAILSLFDESIESDADVSSATLYSRVGFTISESITSDSDGEAPIGPTRDALD
ncbi:hypothetical protein GGI21_003968, partial [Coemansia aciculifera]